MKQRVSNVEAFRQWEADEDASMADLLDKLSGEFKPSPAMVAGTAFHSMLETMSGVVEITECECMGHRFLFDSDMQMVLAPVRELRASKTYMVDGLPVTISGQVDAIDGVTIEDHKTAGRFDPERYVDGCQWKLYLDIFGAAKFRWNVFELQEVEGVDMPTYDVLAMHTLEQYRYIGMEAELQSLVKRFARFVRENVECAA